MKSFSLNRHTELIVFYLILLPFAVAGLQGCYSFTGASVPPHLKTLRIPTVEDRSGFGNAPQYRQILSDLLINAFRNDNSFDIREGDTDALLSSAISSIRDEVTNVSTNELESERKVTVTVRVIYEDQVKNAKIWEKNFTQFQVYDIDGGISARDAAIEDALEQISEDVVLAVVSGW